MTWWGWTILGGIALVAIISEVRRYRAYKVVRYGCSNGSCSVPEGPKKGPPRGGTGVEYGGHHLP